MALQIGIAVALVAVDQLSKILLEPFLMAQSGASCAFIDGFMSLTLVHNTGVAWGMFDQAGIFVAIFTTVVILGVIYFMYRTRTFESKLYKLALAFIIGGAIGNLIDRYRCGYVIDFFHFEFIEFPVFNVADICITVGAVLMVCFLLFCAKSEPALMEIHKTGKKTAPQDHE